ncbi:MAG: STAS domain-containing protein [Lachnospiraceae bacterium]|nr:STAS domain-containing protein [Lachnospiraceae bacterium]
MLSIDYTENGADAKLALEGRLDANTSKDLKTKVGEIPESILNIDMDISKLEYTSSAGLRVVLQLHNQLNQRGGKLVISHPNEVISEVFEDTGLSDCLNIVR